MGFNGLRVLALESRRHAEMGVLIEKNGGVATVAPSMREVPIEDNPEVFAFYNDLRSGAYDMVVLLTGVGARAVESILSTKIPPGLFAEQLKKVTVVPRGPKPQAVLREWGVPWAVSVPSPNTWRELLVAVENIPGRRVVVQEYGATNIDLLDGLRKQGREVTPVRVYQWDLPLDTAPLRAAAERLANGDFDVILLTTSIQIFHLLRVASQEGLEPQVRLALERMAICSIGPTTSEALEFAGFHADLEPTAPKMGVLVKESGDRAGDIIARKRGT